MNRNTTALLAILCMAWMAAPAEAIRIYGASNPGNRTGSADGFLNLGTDHNDNAIGDSLQFNVAKKTRAIVTFSAECAVEGEPADWISVDILVDGVAIGSSTGTSDAFCAADATETSNDGWVMASMAIQEEFLPGNHTVQVRVQLRGGAAGWWLGDTEVTVLVQKK